MTHVNLELPDTLTSMLHCTSKELSKEIYLAVAIFWYQQGRISQEWAAKIATLDRTDFLLTLSQMGKDSFQVDFEDLDKELEHDANR